MRKLSPIEKQRGEQLAQFLAAGQNLDADAPGQYEEIERLLEWCQQMHSLYVGRPPLSQSPERAAYERQMTTMQHKINRQVLCKYQVFPRLEVSEQGFATGWESVQPLDPAIVRAIWPVKSVPPPIGPHSAIHIILDMITAGTIDRIRRCENPKCRKWLMVTSTKRTTCSDACRFEKFKMQKGSRANDMRKSRETHKNHPQLKKQKGRKSHGARKG